MADFNFISAGPVATLDMTGFGSAFGLLKTAHEQTIVHFSFPYNINAQLFTTTVANGGSASQANSMASVATGTANNGSALLQSKDAVKYVPGQGVIARWTAVFTAGKANSTQYLGVGNAQDGFFFGYSGATFGIIHRNAGVDTFIAQADWNGTAMPTLDPTKGNVYSVAYQYLGFGFIRFYVESAATGLRVLVHSIMYPNSAVVPSLGNPTLGLHVQVTNSGNTSNLVLSTASMGIAIEAPLNRFGLPGAALNRKTGITSTVTNILTMRNNASYAGKTNQVRVHLMSVCFSATGSGAAAEAQFQLVLNATLGGVPSYTDFSTNESVVSTDVAGTTLTGGRRILNTIIEVDTSEYLHTENAMEIVLNPGDTLTAACVSAAGTVAPSVAFNWREEF